MKPVVYLITGVSGSGKSWVCQQLLKYAKYIPYDKTSVKEAIDDMAISKSPVIYDPTINVSTFMKRNSDLLDIKLLVVGDDFLAVKQQLLNRGGKVTKSLYVRWKRMNQLKKLAIFSGSSRDVLKFMKEELKPNNKIYKVTSPSGKVYIGKTKNEVYIRIQSHFSDARTRKTTFAFAKAINKYGQDSFTWETLVENVESFNHINYLEKLYIAKFKANDPQFGYNLTEGGDGGQLVKDALDKKRKAMKAYYRSADGGATKEKLRKSSAEMRKNRPDLVEKTRAARQTAESRAKTGRLSKARYASQEARDKQSIKLKEVYSDPTVQRKATMANRKARAKSFTVTDMNGNVIGTWDSPSACSEDLNIARNGIYACLKGRAQYSSGYKFKYCN